MVGAKVTARRPSPVGRESVSAPEEMASRPSGTTRVTSNTAFKSGSSQHGNARRALVDSN